MKQKLNNYELLDTNLFGLETKNLKNIILEKNNLIIDQNMLINQSKDIKDDNKNNII